MCKGGLRCVLSFKGFSRVRGSKAKGYSRVFQDSFMGDSRKIKGCLEGDLRVFQNSSKVTSKEFKGCVKDILITFHFKDFLRVFIGIQRCYNDLSRVFHV